MRRRRLLAGGALVVLVLVLAAVGAVAARRSGSPASLVAFSDDPLVTCGGAASPFPASRLGGPDVDALAPTPTHHELFAALRTASQMPELSPGASGWRLALETPNKAELVRRNREGYGAASFARREGTWKLSGLGNCSALTVEQPKLSVVTMVLDTRHPITPDTIRLHLIVQEDACNGGNTTTASEVVGPRVHVDAHRIVVTAAVHSHRTGFQTCDGPIQFADGGFEQARPPGVEITVTLDAPVDDRSVLDGTRFPYAPIATWSG